MNDNENIDFYLGNFEGMLEDLTEGGDIGQIRKTSFPHAMARIEQFENSNFNLSQRKKFVKAIIDLIAQCRFVLNETAGVGSEHYDFLDDLTKSLLSQFSDVKLDSDRTTLSTEEKIIILDYLGVLDFLSKQGLNQKELAELFGLLLERNRDNVKKAISGIGGKIKLRGSVRNQKSLLGVKAAVAKLNYRPLIEKVTEDLGSLE